MQYRIYHWFFWTYSILGSILLQSACQGDTTRVIQRSFERSQDVAFACFDEVTTDFLPLEACQTTLSEDPTSSNRLIAFVTQGARGEVAAVDLEDENQGGGLLDTDRRVPGVTFRRVGEVPTAIVISPENPAWTYIAEFGSRQVRGVPTRSLHPEAPSLDAEEDQVR
ncbi:MAG: hypothetical protein AAGJ35_14155, partial [Myxococcota bacterium]